MTSHNKPATPLRVDGPPPDIEICVLGPLEVRIHGVGHPIRSTHGRRLLAHLAYRHPHGSRRDELIDHVWEGDVSPSPKALQMQIVRLRQHLGKEVIDTTPEGMYRLGRTCEIDMDHFVAARDRAREALASGGHERAAEVTTAALARWRGDPWDELDDDVEVHSDRARLLRIRNELYDLAADALSEDDAQRALEHLQRFIDLRSDSTLWRLLSDRLHPSQTSHTSRPT